MCDTWVALPDATLSGKVLFAKNSDRPVFDCQPLLLRPRMQWPAGSKIMTGTIELAQAEVTYAHLGSSPYWCWGYEEGLNEWGLAIGNEAVYSKASREAVDDYRLGKPNRPGLLGMDLIRLALERCSNSGQAVELIGALIEEYGQFGSANPGKPHDEGSYDNSFLLADPRECWILETAGRRWVARRLQQGIGSISNELSIRSEWDLGSPDLEAHARHKGWWPGDSPLPFDFAQAYIDDQTPRHLSHPRMMRSRQLLSQRIGRITPQWMMRIARDHYEGTYLQGPLFDAANPDLLSLCMHVSPAGFTWGNTASSCVAELPAKADGLPVLWWTPGPPCNGCYVPFFPHGSRLPEIVSRAGKLGKQVIPATHAREDQFSLDSYWWLFRQLNDRVKGDTVKSIPGCYHERNRQVRARFDQLEQSFTTQLPDVLRRAASLRETRPEQTARILDEFSETCLIQVVAALEDLRSIFPAAGGE